MRFLTITGSISIKPDWANISGEILKAGTPLSIVGTVADSSSAVGILANDAHLGDAEVNVVVSGMIDLGEITASYGELTDDAIAAMKGISFVDGGSVVVPSGGGGGGETFIITVTPNDEETELSVDKTYQEIASAFAEGKTFYFSWNQYPRPFAADVYEDDGTYYIEGVNISLEPVAEDMADISILTIYVTADSVNGVTAFSAFSSVTGTYYSIPPFA